MPHGIKLKDASWDMRLHLRGEPRGTSSNGCFMGLNLRGVYSISFFFLFFLWIKYKTLRSLDLSKFNFPLVSYNRDSTTNKDTSLARLLALIMGFILGHIWYLLLCYDPLRGERSQSTTTGSITFLASVRGPAITTTCFLLSFIINFTWKILVDLLDYPYKLHPKLHHIC